MATLLRDVERPAFLDAPSERQMALSGVASPARAPLSERLRAERAAGTSSAAEAHRQTDAARGGGATLDELLAGAWEGLSARRPVACMVCAGAMQPRAGAHGGTCGDCGSGLC